jgi:hypothetical protein
VEEPDHGHRRLLRAGCQRPYRCAIEDQLPLPREPQNAYLACFHVLCLRNLLKITQCSKDEFLGASPEIAPTRT